MATRPVYTGGGDAWHQTWRAGSLTFPCMSSLMVKVTLSPPSTRLESIAAGKSRVKLWWGAERLKREDNVTIRDRCSSWTPQPFKTAAVSADARSDAGHHTSGKASYCSLITCVCHFAKRRRRLSPVIHVRLARLPWFTLAQWPTVSMGGCLFPGMLQLWRHRLSFIEWVRITERELLIYMRGSLSRVRVHVGNEWLGKIANVANPCLFWWEQHSHARLR